METASQLEIQQQTGDTAPIVDMARSVSHDLRNVLCWMGAYLDELREHCSEEGLELIDELDRANSEITHMTRLLSQINHAPVVEDQKIVNISNLLNQQADFIGKLNPDIPINRRIDSHLATVGDAGQLTRVIQNLLANACDAIEDCGAIEIGAEAIDDKVIRFWVSDNGQGMPKPDQARAFERYFTSKGDDGSGIGLANVKEIVEGHAGNVSMISTLNIGTTFSVILPKAPVTV